MPGKACYQVWRTNFEIDTKYQPIKAIGKGAYGVVCSAKNDETGEKVRGRQGRRGWVLEGKQRACWAAAGEEGRALPCAKQAASNRRAGALFASASPRLSAPLTTHPATHRSACRWPSRRSPTPLRIWWMPAARCAR